MNDSKGKIKESIFLPDAQIFIDLSPIFNRFRPQIKDLPALMELLKEHEDLLQVLYITDVDPDIVEKHSKLIKQLRKAIGKCKKFGPSIGSEQLTK